MAACGYGNNYEQEQGGCDPCNSGGGGGGGGGGYGGAEVDPGYGADAGGGYGAGGGGGGSGYNPGTGGGDGGYGGGGGGGGGSGYNPGYGAASTLPAPVDSGYGGGDGGYAGASTLPAPVDAGYGGGGGGGYEGASTLPAPADCADCGSLVRTTRKVQVPCTRNEYKTYKVKVPVTVNEKVARTVNYVDYEDRQKTVSYQVNVAQTRFKEQQQQYTVKVPKQGTRMVSVTKKVPRTIYVDVTTQEERPYCEEVEETRSRMVKIPYTINVPETRFKTVMEKTPVSKCRTVYDDVQKQTWIDQEKTVCTPVTKMVTKEIPVYHWQQQQPGPCAGGNCGPEPIQPREPMPQPPREEYSERTKTVYEAPAKYDTNNDGVLDEGERAAAAAAGDLKVDTQVIGESLRNSRGSAQGLERPSAQGAAGQAQNAAANAQSSMQQTTTQTTTTMQNAAGGAGGAVAAQGQRARSGASRASSRARRSSSRRRSGRSKSGRSSRRRSSRR